MAGWNNKNCCCEPKTFVCGDGVVDICCLTLQLSTWVRPITCYTIGNDPGDTCAYTSNTYYHNNHCGRVINFGCTVYTEISWGIQADGTVRLFISMGSQVDGDYNYVAPVIHVITGLDADTWYTAPVVFTLSGVTYTLEVCPDPHTPFPEWPISTVNMKVTGLPSEGRGVGSVLCGTVCDPFHAVTLIMWKYNIYNDTVKIDVSFPTHVGSHIVAYDDGDWINNTYTFTIPALLGGAPDATVTVSGADSCTIPPPPEPCVVENACFPDGCPCIIDGSDGSLYRTLTADISGPVTATGLTLIPYLAEGWDYSSGGDSIAIRCTNGGVDPYYVFVSIGGTVMFGSIPAGGFDCTPDGLDIVDITVTDGITTMVLYTL